MEIISKVINDSTKEENYNINQIKIKYIKSYRNIKLSNLFNITFLENNKDKFKIIYNGKEQKLN